MKILSNFLYSTKQGIKGFFTNKAMSFISVISVSSALIILGIVLTIVLNINQFIEVTKDEINEIRLAVESDITENDREDIESSINRIEGIKEFEYQTKEESFDTMKDSWGEDAYLLEGVDNPLDDYYVVKIENPDEIDSIASKLLTIENTTDVEYYQDIMENFMNISNIVKKFGIVVIGALLLICLVIISNTIKSRVHSKREEIQIIKYVGASNSFTVAPFIVEGFLIGAVGSTLAIGMCIGMYSYIIEKTTSVITSIVGNVVVPTTEVSMPLIFVLAITGISVGVLGSGLSVKKHLKV